MMMTSYDTFTKSALNSEAQIASEKELLRKINMHFKQYMIDFEIKQSNLTQAKLLSAISILLGQLLSSDITIEDPNEVQKWIEILNFQKRLKIKQIQTPATKANLRPCLQFLDFIINRKYETEEFLEDWNQISILQENQLPTETPIQYIERIKMQIEQETAEDIIKAFRKYEQGQPDDEQILQNSRDKLLSLIQVQEQRYEILQSLLKKQIAHIESLKSQQNQTNFLKEENQNFARQIEQKQQELQLLQQQLAKEQIACEDLAQKEKHLTNKLEAEKKNLDLKTQELGKQREIIGETPHKLNDQIDKFDQEIEVLEKQVQIEKQKLDNETELLKYNLEKGQNIAKEFNQIKLHETQNPQMEQINVSGILFKKEEDNFDKKKMMEKLMQHRQCAEANAIETKNQEKYFLEKINKHKQNICSLQTLFQELSQQYDSLLKVSFDEDKNRIKQLNLKEQELKNQSQLLKQKVQKTKNRLEKYQQRLKDKQAELQEDMEYYDTEINRYKEDFDQQMKNYQAMIQDVINEGIRIVKLQKGLVKMKNKFFESFSSEVMS